MYTVTGAGDVFAIDATDGTILWRYDAHLPPAIEHRLLRLGEPRPRARRRQASTSRGLDATLVALSQQDGHVLWSASNGNPQDGYTMTMAPLYYNGLVIVGVSGGEFGARGSVTAYDARDGHLVWRFYTVPSPGQLGSDTWPANNEWQTGGATGLEHAERRPEARAPLLHDRQRVPVVDARRRATTSSRRRSSRSTPMTGAYRWHYQVVHHDIWDYDCASNTVLFATTHPRPRPQGRRRAVQDRLGLRARPADRHAGARRSRRSRFRRARSSTRRRRSRSRRATASPTQCARRSVVPADRVRRAALQVRLHLHAVRRARVHRRRAGRARGRTAGARRRTARRRRTSTSARATRSPRTRRSPSRRAPYSGGRAFVGVDAVGSVRASEITPGAFTRGRHEDEPHRLAAPLHEDGVHGQIDASCDERIAGHRGRARLRRPAAGHATTGSPRTTRRRASGSGAGTPSPASRRRR